MKEEIIDELLDYFINESEDYFDTIIPKKLDDKRYLLRGLINVREPKITDERILKLEDKLLKLELDEKEIIDVMELSEVERNICLYRGDITTLKADLIVNAGNRYGLGCFVPNHSCIDNAIHSYAGIRLRLECDKKLGGRTLREGDILVTSGYNLPSSYVITTVGPEIKDKVTEIDELNLSKCYENCLKYAIENNYKSIVFPSISTGLFGFPIKRAKYIAYDTVKKVIGKSNIRVIFNVFSKEDYNEYRKLFKNKKTNR